MATNEDWSPEENRLIVRTAFDLLESGGANPARPDLPSACNWIDGQTARWSSSFGNVSFVMRELGLSGIPGYGGRPPIQQALVPEVVRQGIEGGLLQAGMPDFVVRVLPACGYARTSCISPDRRSCP